MIASVVDYLRRAAARPFAPELLQPVCVLAGIALALLATGRPF
jgi:hypothetical protein